MEFISSLILPLGASEEVKAAEMKWKTCSSKIFFPGSFLARGPSDKLLYDRPKHGHGAVHDGVTTEG